MRRFSMALAAVVLTSSAVATPTPTRADATGTAMAKAATRFLGTLDDAQREKASFSFDDPERLNWHWIPRARKGLPIKEMAPDQRAVAFGLIQTGLSTEGMIKVTTIMSYERILHLQENRAPHRDAELYFLSVFGTPGDQGEWGWRLEGHHLSLNFTLRDGEVVSATPFQFGSNPAGVRSGPLKGQRNLLDLETPIKELIASFDDAQREAAVISDVVPKVTSSPNTPLPGPMEPKGVSTEQLNRKQRKLLNQFFAAYRSNFAPGVRKDLKKELARSKGEFHLAWYGPLDQSKPHAFRIEGPSILIDFNNEQDGANHIHTFYRNRPGDFDLTAE